MKTVSFQGTQLSSTQRARLQFEQQTRARFMNSHLADQVQQTIAALDQRREQGARPEKVWFLESNQKFTQCFADVFGF